ncbi:MAG: hypothetical protein OEZ22_10110 [Spirochaetia bacterium]|nr:hypothetical protein [Spirochaetia bacterium]
MKSYELPGKIKNILLAFIVIGIGSIVAGFTVDAQRAWAGTLALTYFLIVLALGGGFFASLQLISGSGWSVVVRRIPELAVNTLYVVGGLIIVIFLGIHNLYEWSHPEAAHDHILHQKHWFLNTAGFVIRILLFLGLWIFMGRWMKNVSIKMDSTKDESTKKTLVKVAGAYILIFAYTFSLASIDLVMSLEPHWFTTMFVIYVFAGLAYTAFSALIILVYIVQKNGALKEVNEEHYHDMGRFLLAFTIFWAYITFSQHMLTWYANLVEETVYLERRLRDGWALFTPLLWIFHFVVPFAFLLSRELKRKPEKLIRVAAFTLFMGFVDVIWLVYGFLDSKKIGFPFSWMEAGIFFGAIGIFGFIVLNSYTKVNQLPVGDPKLKESLDFHQTY